MTQADSVLSTPPTNTSARPSRRSILGTIVGGAAAASSVAAFALPTAKASEADPIFAAIETYGRAKAKSDARFAQVKSLYQEAALVGLDNSSGLADQNAFIEARIGCDPDDYTDETASAFWDIADEFFRTQPTSLAGILAMLRHADDLGADESTLIEEGALALISTLRAAAEAVFLTGE